MQQKYQKAHQRKSIEADRKEPRSGPRSEPNPSTAIDNWESMCRFDATDKNKQISDAIKCDPIGIPDGHRKSKTAPTAQRQNFSLSNGQILKFRLRHVCQPQRPVRKYLNVKEMLDGQERIFSLTSSDWMRPNPTEAGHEHDQKDFHFHW